MFWLVLPTNLNKVFLGKSCWCLMLIFLFWFLLMSAFPSNRKLFNQFSRLLKILTKLGSDSESDFIDPFQHSRPAQEDFLSHQDITISHPYFRASQRKTKDNYSIFWWRRKEKRRFFGLVQIDTIRKAWRTGWYGRYLHLSIRYGFVASPLKTRKTILFRNKWEELRTKIWFFSNWRNPKRISCNFKRMWIYLLRFKEIDPELPAKNSNLSISCEKLKGLQELDHHSLSLIRKAIRLNHQRK